MASPYVGEIRIMSFNFPPKGWAFCNGQLMIINQNQALFSLLGTTYGGDGVRTFALPNLQGRVPVHMGNGFTLGQLGGEEAHTLIFSEMPPHPHGLQGTTLTADTAIPTGALLASVSNVYTGASNLTTLNPETVGYTGGTQPHPNMQPYLTLSFCIALSGIFPTQG